MNYEQFLPFFPKIEASTFARDLGNKKEFSDLRRASSAINVGSKTSLVLERFFNKHTPYEELLIFNQSDLTQIHAVLKFVEHNLASKCYKRVFILTHSTTSVHYILEQLVFRCAADRYQTKLGHVKAESKWRELKQVVSDFYQIQTYDDFHREISKFEIHSNELIEVYSDSLFILNEIHFLTHPSFRPLMSSSNSSEPSRESHFSQIYSFIHAFLHDVKNRKILLISSSPVTKQMSDLIPILNLILPTSEQIPLEDESFQPTSSTATKIQGRLYHIPAVSISNSVTQIRYMGSFVSSHQLEEFKCFGTLMVEPQLSSYLRTFKAQVIDRSQELTSSIALKVTIELQMASLFVFPNGAVDRKAYELYVVDSANQHRKWFQDLRDITRLNNHSNKFAHAIANILNNPNKLVYVYCSIAQPLILFSKILELYGFHRARGTETQKGKRFFILQSTSKFSPALQLFNSSRNSHADYCQVALVGWNVNENFLLKNVQIIHILTNAWNRVEQTKILKRAIKIHSHDALIQQGFYPIVQIFQHASLLNNAVQSTPLPTPTVPQSSIDLQIYRSIDLSMLQAQTLTQIDLDKIERFISACSIMSNEQQQLQAMPRDSAVSVDTSTYNLYHHSRQGNQNIINGICKIFEFNPVIHILTLQNMLEVELFQLLEALSFMIRRNYPIINSHGMESFLREENNLYYLVNNPVLPSRRIELNLYNKSPFIFRDISLPTLLREPTYLNNLNKIRAIKDAQTEEEIANLLRTTSVEIQEMFLERALEIKYYSSSPYNNPLVDWIENIYRHQGVLDHSDEFNLISLLLEPKIRCHNGKEWIDYSPALAIEKNDLIINQFTDNVFGIYGIVDEMKNEFCIKDFREAIFENNSKMLDRRKIKTISFVESNKLSLIEICMHLKLPVPAAHLVSNPKEKLMESKLGRRCFDQWKHLDNPDLCKVLHWLESNKKDILIALKQWLTEQGLLVQGECSSPSTAAKLIKATTKSNPSNSKNWKNPLSPSKAASVQIIPALPPTA